MKRVFLIVISGGPCAGKTSALPIVKKELEKQGFLTFLIKEAATELMENGVTYEVCNGALGFQSSVMELQLARENLFMRVANTTSYSTQDIVIICDRGAIDCLAYLTDDEKITFLELFNTSYLNLLNRYDAVFHMVSVADKNESAYSSITNTVRFESPEEAILTDKRNLDIWSGHNNCYIIDYSDSFQTKVEKLVDGIIQFLKTKTESS